MTWVKWQLFGTSIALLLAVLLFESTNLDFFVQDRFYNFTLHRWIWSDDEPISKFFLYDAIRAVYILGAFTLLGVVAFFGNLPSMQNLKKGLVIICISLIVVPGVVNLGKAVSNIPCPKNLEHYGGDYPHATLFRDYPEGFQQEGTIRCYPAGHASGGFALLSLYFLCRRRQSRIAVVAGVIALSWTVGVYKMVIGDHFLSHTVVTMLLAWWLILIITWFIYSDFRPGPLESGTVSQG